jgi:ABC-type sulfate transport system permease subunit
VSFLNAILANRNTSLHFSNLGVEERTVRTVFPFARSMVLIEASVGMDDTESNCTLNSVGSSGFLAFVTVTDPSILRLEVLFDHVSISDFDMDFKRKAGIFCAG